MYEEFYGFRDRPFRLTPDPNYLFLSTNHQEALGHLLFGVKEGSGVVVITGEIGAGKTTLLRTLVRNLDDNTIIAYIFNPALSAIELLQTINTELGLPSSSTSKKELIDELNRFLLTQQAAGRRVVVIIDEAQDLEPSVLEQLRLLSNLETERDKLLEIMLVGQPELRDILARPELAQLDQRVTLRWHLGPLNRDETATYVRHRIRVAADGREPVQFTASALAAVYRLSGGIPRLINVLCHRALLIGYTREERQIDRPIMLQAAKELDRKELVREHAASPRFSAALRIGALVLLGTVALVFASTHGWLSVQTRQKADEPHLAQPQAAETTRDAVPTPTASLPSDSAASTTSSSVEKSQAEQQAEAIPSSPAASATTLVEQPAMAASQSAPTPTAPMPPVASTQESSAAQAFLQELQQFTVVDNAVQAANNLLRVWDATPLRAEEWRAGEMNLGTIAHARRLEYTPVNGALSLLSLLDLPAILELTTPAQHEPRFVLLLSVHEKSCRLLLAHEHEVPFQLLTEHWLGKAHLFWRDFENVGPALTVGSIGQQVKRLHTLLSQAPGLEARFPANARTDTYDRHTQELVARFQKSKRLSPDGVVGPQTMITLYNAIAKYPRPTLRTGDAPAQDNRGAEAQASDPTLQDAHGNRQRNPYEHHS
ncbi:MAG: AAA family ATPase [Deltaproteobacteria bacterium]|nr:AAA family ATPase [Deltaproteobacteria bacterium]